jgi:hypothetical protein
VQQLSVARQVQSRWPLPQGDEEVMPGKGLYENIAAKRRRIKEGSGEKMRKPSTKGAPTAKAFRESAKTAKKAK